MILTKRHIMEILKNLPSDKNSECGAILYDAKQRLKHELETIKQYEDNENSLFVQFMKRVGHYQTKDYIFQYVEEVDGVSIRRKKNNAICATVHDGKTICTSLVSEKSDLYHIPKFKTCETCGCPIQEIYIFDEKHPEIVNCRDCFSTKMNTKYGRGCWQFTMHETMEDNEK